jgi:hypothetical protein
MLGFNSVGVSFTGVHVIEDRNVGRIKLSQIRKKLVEAKIPYVERSLGKRTGIAHHVFFTNEHAKGGLDSVLDRFDKIDDYRKKRTFIQELTGGKILSAKDILLNVAIKGLDYLKEIFK